MIKHKLQNLQFATISAGAKQIAYFFVIAAGLVLASCTTTNVEDRNLAEPVNVEFDNVDAVIETPTDQGNQSGTECIDHELFCVALVTTTDGLQYFENQTRQAVERAESDLIAQVWFEEVSNEAAASTLQKLGEQNYDVIITIGDDLGRESIIAYSQFSHPQFITINQNNFFVSEDNLIALNFPEYEAGFLAGTLAAHVTESNVVAIVTPGEAYSYELGDGFVDGVASVSSDVRTLVLTDIDDSGTLDPTQVRELVENLVNEGVDIIYAGGGDYGDLVLTESAKKSSLSCIGMVEDQWIRLPNARSCLITSTIYQLELTLIDTMARILLEPGNHDLHQPTSGGFVGYAPLRDFEQILPAQVKADIFDAREQLNSNAFINE